MRKRINRELRTGALISLIYEYYVARFGFFDLKKGVDYFDHFSVE